MKQIYLIKSHLKHELIDYLTNTNKYLMNVDIMDINQYINNIIDLPSDFDAYRKLKIYKLINPKDDLSTFKELLSYKKLFNQFNVNYHDLNIVDDIKMCLDDLPEFNYHKLFLIDEDLSYLHIFDGNYNAFETKVIDYLISKGASLFSFPTTKDIKAQWYKPCLTPRHEIETLCQYLHSNQDIELDQAIIYYTNPNMLNLYETVLKRYEIPYHFDKVHNLLSDKFIALYDFYKKPNIQNYLRIVKLNIFTLCKDSVIKYLSLHLKNEDLLKDLAIIDINDYYLNMSLEANKIHQKIYPILKELLSIKDLKDLMTFIYDLIKEDSDYAYSLKSYLEENINDLDEDTLLLFIDKLSTLSIKDKRAGILLSPLKDYYHYKYLFVLDCNNKDFLKPESYEGIISEKVLLESGIADISLRYDLALKHLSFLQSAQTIYFNNQTSLEGKESEASVLIEDLPILAFEMIENNHYYNPNHNLDPNLVFETLFKDGKLNASVSSLEKYQRCQYSYYLNYILKLYSPFTIELNAAYVGSLIHSIFEDLINEYHKAYCKVEDSVIKTCLDQKMHDLFILYPNDTYILDIIKDLIFDAIKTEMKFLIDYEDSQSFIPKASEYHFDIDYLDSLHLKGSIDRIDELNDHFQIIDYKTSEHNISLTNVQKGLQLQLITYLLIYYRLSKKEASGFYYLNLNHTRDDISYFKYGRSGFETVLNDNKDNFIKNHRLSGVNLDGNTNEYYKLSSSKALKNIDIKSLEKANNVILDKIVASIKDGNIAINPTLGACDYCPYKIICNYHGSEHHLEDLYIFDKEESDE